MADGLHTFHSLEIVEVPSAGPGTANDPTAKAPVGVMYRHLGNVFRYVKFYQGAIPAAATKVGYWYALDPPNGIFTVSCDVSACIAAGVNLCAGVLGAVVTNGYYTWIQVAGVCDAVCAAGVVAGDKLIYGGDGAFARVAAGGALTDQCYAIALGTVDPSSYVGSVLLQNLDW